MSAPLNPFTQDSWQYTLWNQGYSANQIRSSENFISSISAATLLSYTGFKSLESARALVAQKYIDNPDSVSSLGEVNYGQPNYVPSSISFSDPTSPPNALYISQDWIQTLKSEGYTNNDISLASAHISKLNIPAGYDLVPLAKTYIQVSKINGQTV
jgi:hypothetical protein